MGVLNPVDNKGRGSHNHLALRIGFELEQPKLMGAGGEGGEGKGAEQGPK